MLSSEVEVYRNAFALMGNKKDPREKHEAFLIVSPQKKAKARLFCSCSKGSYATCSAANILQEHFDNSMYGAVLYNRFKSSKMYQFFSLFMKNDPLSLSSINVEKTDSPDLCLRFYAKNGRLLAEYKDTLQCSNRLLGRLGLSDSTLHKKRRIRIEKCRSFVRSPAEKEMNDFGVKTSLQQQEDSFWYNLAYHWFREHFSESDEIALTHLFRKDIAGVFTAIDHGESASIIVHTLPRSTSSLISSQRFKRLLQFEHNQTPHEIYFKIALNKDGETVQIECCLGPAGDAPPAELWTVDRNHVYSNALYIPEKNCFYAVSSHSNQILSRLNEIENELPQEQFSSLLHASPDLFSFPQEQEHSGQLSLFSTEVSENFERIIGVTMVRSISHIAVEPIENKGTSIVARLWYKNDDSLIDLFDISRCRKKKQRFAMSKNAVFDLQSDDFRAIKLWGIRFSDKGTIIMSKSTLLRLRNKNMVIRGDETCDLVQQCRAMIECRSRGAVRVGGNYKSKLRDYQKKGLEWLTFLFENSFGGLLCDDMGLGKSHQILALLCQVFNRKDVHKPVLIIAPTTVISHWESIIEKFSTGLSVLAYYGSSRSLESVVPGTCVLTSYGILRTDEMLQQCYWDMVIFDEAQHIKNRSTAGWKYAQNLNAEIKIGVTGTPVENSLQDLKSLFDIVLPGFLGNNEEFYQDFLLPIENQQDFKENERLKAIIAPFILRRAKEDVLLELPPCIEDKRCCIMDQDQKKKYNAILTRDTKKLKEDLYNEHIPLPYTNILAALVKLKQACSHPVLLESDVSKWNTVSCAKFDLCTELLSESLDANNKTVIFTQFLGMVEIFSQYCEAMGIGCITLTGSSRNRGELIKKFQTDPDCKVFICSLLAGGVGIDLTAASVVIHYDRWWNSAREQQATDRVHRMGQENSVLVYKLITTNTIEDRIDQIIARKKRLVDSVLDIDSPESVKMFTREEILEMLKVCG